MEMGSTALMPWGEVLMLSDNPSQGISRWKNTSPTAGLKGAGRGEVGFLGDDGQAGQRARPMTQEARRMKMEEVRELEESKDKGRENGRKRGGRGRGRDERDGFNRGETRVQEGKSGKERGDEFHDESRTKR